MSVPRRPAHGRAPDRRAGSDDGQVALLVLVLVLVLVAALGVTTAASSLYLARKRLMDVADATALGVVDDLTLAGGAGTAPRARYDDATVRAAAVALVATDPAAARIADVRVGGPTGRAGADGVQVTVTGTARPPLLTVFVPRGVTLSATARARLLFTVEDGP